MKTEVSASTLLAVAITLISMGISFLQQGNISPGVICVALGIALVFATILLIEKGVIDKMLEKLRNKKTEA